MADRFFSIDSDYGFADHIRQYFITEPVSGVDLKLDIIGDETITAENDVTDHYVESNIAYQDQISIKPKTYTINGEVGELVWYQRDSISQKVGQVAQRLEGLISFLPTRSRSFQQMKKNVMKAAQWFDTASNILDRFDSLTPEMTKQQQAFNWLLFWRDKRSPLLVQSPWGLLSGYVITSLSVTQPRETKDKSLVSITFKEFRTTSVSTVKFDAEKYQGNAMEENQPKVDNGTTDGEDKSTSEEKTETNPKTGKPIKKFVSTVDISEDRVFKFEYDPQSEILDIYYPDGKLLDERSYAYDEVYEGAMAKIKNSIGGIKIYGD